MQFIKKYATYFIGFIVFLLIIGWIDLEKTMQILLNTNPVLFVVSMLMFIPMFFTKILRWKFIMDKQKIHYSVGKCSSMYLSALYIGLVTPGKVGELIRTFYLKRDGVAFGRGFFSVFFDRFYDLLALLSIAYLGLFLFAEVFRTLIVFLTVVGLIGAAALGVFILKKNTLGKIVKFIIARATPKKYRDDIENTAREFYKDIRILGPASLFYIVFLSFLSWFAHFIQVQLLAMSIGMDVSMIHIAFVVSVATLLSLLPVSLLGVGTRDASFVFLFAMIGITKEISVALSTLMLITTVIFAFFSMFFWFKNPVSMKNEG